mmetsp:Transcript_32293/g.74619  ORF Transcript_32293/g.74619 Transcript_32293/m.74619 type:complete len:200 (-) Transcript_32293:484-1083(-)
MENSCVELSGCTANRSRNSSLSREASAGASWTACACSALVISSSRSLTPRNKPTMLKISAVANSRPKVEADCCRAALIAAWPVLVSKLLACKVRLRKLCWTLLRFCCATSRRAALPVAAMLAKASWDCCTAAAASCTCVVSACRCASRACADTVILRVSLLICVFSCSWSTFSSSRKDRSTGVARLSKFPRRLLSCDRR